MPVCQARNHRASRGRPLARADDCSPRKGARGMLRSMNGPTGGTWFVYILRSHDDSLYTGTTTDPERRCRQHNAGTAARYTRGRRPTSLVYHEAHASLSLALKREAAIKALSRRHKELLIRKR